MRIGNYCKTHHNIKTAKILGNINSMVSTIEEMVCVVEIFSVTNFIKPIVNLNIFDNRIFLISRTTEMNNLC